MKEINSRTAKNQFGQLLESAQRGPVRVTRRGRAVGVLLSEEQYQRLRGMAWDRLANTTAAMRKQAADSGLGPGSGRVTCKRPTSPARIGLSLARFESNLKALSIM